MPGVALLSFGFAWLIGTAFQTRFLRQISTALSSPRLLGKIKSFELFFLMVWLIGLGLGGASGMSRGSSMRPDSTPLCTHGTTLVLWAFVGITYMSMVSRAALELRRRASRSSPFA